MNNEVNVNTGLAGLAQPPVLSDADVENIEGDAYVNLQGIAVSSDEAGGAVFESASPVSAETERADKLHDCQDRSAALPHAGECFEALSSSTESEQAEPGCGAQTHGMAGVQNEESGGATPEPEQIEELDHMAGRLDSTTDTWHGYSVHPVCAKFPVMNRNELADLAADIRRNGLVHDIITHQGQIVDGRHRLKACLEAGVEPRFSDWRAVSSGSMPLARWIWSMNAERRHLSRDQILTIRLEICQWEKQECARKRQAEGRRRGGETAGRGRPKADSLTTISSATCTDAPRPDHGDDAPPSGEERDHSGDVRAEVAAEIGESQYRVQQAMNLKKANPAAYNTVKTGEATLRRAANLAKPAIDGMKRSGPKRRISRKDGPTMPTKAGTTDADADKVKATEKVINRGTKGIEKLYHSLPEDQQKYFAEEIIAFVRLLLR
jgi:hypothetical protein